MVTRAKFIYARKIHKHFAPIPVLEIWNDFSPKKERCLIYKFHNGIATLVAYSVNSLETLSNLVKVVLKKNQILRKFYFKPLSFLLILSLSDYGLFTRAPLS